MNIINTEKAAVIEIVRQAQKDLAKKLAEVGDGKEYFADLIVVTDPDDNPLFVARLKDGLIDKQEIVLTGPDGGAADAVEHLLHTLR